MVMALKRGNVHETREGWLRSAMDLLKPIIEKAEGGFTVPDNIQVSCGWPRWGSGQAIGQCWSHTYCVEGKYQHIFISPELHDRHDVLATLLHEMVHAVVGTKEGHRGKFAKLARAVGLQGKLTATVVLPDNPLHAVLKRIADDLGPYPHVGLKKPKKRAKHDDRYINLYSRTLGTEYKIRMATAMLKEHGWPSDPMGERMVTEDQLGGTGEEDEEE
jgi:hypothetical protein